MKIVCKIRIKNKEDMKFYIFVIFNKTVIIIIIIISIKIYITYYTY